MIQTPFSSLLVSKINGKLQFLDVKKCETRNDSTAKQIFLTDKKYNLKDFDWILVNTDDRNVCTDYHGLRVFSYSTPNDDFSNVIPDFCFDGWPQVQIDDYTKTSEDMSHLGDIDPQTNLLGWRGAMTHPNRTHLFRFTDKNKYDIEEIHWDRTNPEKLTCTNYISLPDSVKKWRYMIDVEGNGYSARVKLLMFSKRVLFLQERPHKEWFYVDMKPWVHYVPVKSDLSDLDENLNRIKQDVNLEKQISNNAFEFAQKNLKMDNALDRWYKILQSI